MNIVHEILEAIPQSDPPSITWGVIVSIGPPISVRFAGDTADIEVGLKNEDVTLADTDKVLLVRAGSQWCIVCTLGAT